MEEPKDPSWLKKDVYEWPSPKGVVTSSPGDDWWMGTSEGWHGHLHHYTPTSKSNVTPLPELLFLPELHEEEDDVKIQGDNTTDNSVEVVLHRQLMPVMEEEKKTAETILDELDAAKTDHQQLFDFSPLPHIKDNRFIKQDAANWTARHHLGSWNFDC